jgi:abortive infection bacteriophage resistance protein
MKFTKPPKTYEDQLALLKQRGLSISSDAETIRWLKRVNYYRLSAYYVPFQEPRPSEQFLAGATWDRVIDLYIFDCRLRHLFKIAMERIEIALRTTITYEVAHEFGAFSHTQQNTFAYWFIHQKDGKPSAFDEFMRNIAKEENRAREVFVRAYRAKYTLEPHLPIWMATELMSFGTLSMMFHGLRSTTKAKIAAHYSVTSEPFQNWMHVFASVRNMTAHNSRLWNRQLGVQAKIPYGWPYIIPATDRIYCVGVMIQYLLSATARGSRWKTRLMELFDLHPNVPLSPMGFPGNWREISPWAQP